MTVGPPPVGPSPHLSVSPDAGSVCELRRGRRRDLPVQMLSRCFSVDRRIVLRRLHVDENHSSVCLTADFSQLINTNATN